MRRWWVLLCLLLAPGVSWAACTTAQMAVSGAGNVPPKYYRCAAFADAPTSGLNAGDTLFVTGTGNAYTATNATTWTQQAGALPLPVSSLTGLGTGTKVATTNATAPASNKCVEFDTAGNLVVAGTNAACGAGGGGGTVTTTGSPASGNLTQFSGATSITTGNLSGDVTTSGTLATTVVKVNGVAYGTAPATNTVPVVTGANTITYEAVPNAALANSALTLNGTSVSLGGTRTLTLASADFLNQGTTTTVLHGNAAGNPSWAAVALGDLAPSSLLGTGTKLTTSSATAPASQQCVEMTTAGTLVVAASGAACGTGGTLATPTGTHSTNAAVTGSATTGLRSDAVPAISTTATFQLGSVGLGMAAPATAGQLAQTLAADGLTGQVIKRFSANTTGIFVDYQTSGGVSKYKVTQTGLVLMRPDTGLAGGFDYYQVGAGGNLGTTGQAYNTFVVDGDSTVTNAGITVYGFNYVYNYGSANPTGGAGTDHGQKIGLNVTTQQTTDMHISGVADTISGNFVVASPKTKGGTDTAGGALGTLFSLSGNTNAQAGASNYLQFGGMEIGMWNYATSSARFRTGMTVVDYGQGGPLGAQIDAAYGVVGAGTPTGWGVGLIFSKSLGGGTPVVATGTLIQAEGSGVSVAHGLDFSAWTFTTDALKTPGFTVDGTGTVTVNTSALSASLQGTGQATAAYNTSTALGGALEVKDTGSGANNGGALLFAASQGRFAAIKGLLSNGANNTQGALAFLVRNFATDATLTAALTLLSTSGMWVGNTPVDPGGNGVLGLQSALAIRDVSAAHQVLIQPNSSVTLSADRLLTLDMANAPHTLQFASATGTNNLTGTAVKGIFNVLDGTNTRPAGLVTEVNSALLEFGINEGTANRFGTATTSDQGGMFRFDTRAGEHMLQVWGRTAGTSSASGVELWYLTSAGDATLTTGSLTVPSIKSTTGTRYVCVDTTGKVVSQASACSGT